MSVLDSDSRPAPIRCERRGGFEIRILAEEHLPLTAADRLAIGVEPFLKHGAFFRATWWEGYGQRPSIDVAVVKSETDAEGQGDAWSLSGESPSDFRRVVNGLRESGHRFLWRELDYDDGLLGGPT